MAERKTALVSNAADAEQVKSAKSKEDRQREQQLNDICAVLAIDSGRRLIWRLLGYCKIHESVMEQSARIYYNAGVQDVGHFILAEILAARPDAFLQMMQEAQKQEKSDG